MNHSVRFSPKCSTRIQNIIVFLVDNQHKWAQSTNNKKAVISSFIVLKGKSEAPFSKDSTKCLSSWFKDFEILAASLVGLVK